jgi:hypothetical protein
MARREPRSLLTRSEFRRRVLFVGVGAVFLVFSVNQLMFQRWGAGAIWGGLGLGLVLAGALSSEATLMHKTIGVSLRLVLWNVGFAVALAAVALSVPASMGDLIGMSCAPSLRSPRRMPDPNFRHST